MQRKFLSSLILIVLLNLLVKPFYILGIDAEVQVRVGEKIYGNYFALLNFSFLLNILLDLGITNYNTRNIAQYPHLLRKNFFKILSLRFSLFLLYASFTFLSGIFVGFGKYELYLLSVLMINQFLVAIIQFSRSNIAGLHLFKTDAFISILDRSLLIVFCSLLLWGNIMGDQFQIEWFVYAQTLAYGISALISVILLKTHIGIFTLKIKKAFSLAILKQSFPYALLIFLMMMYNRLDAVMIERLLPDGNEQAGIYAQGFRILDAVNMFALLFAGLLLPIFSRLIKEKGDVKQMMELALRILIAFSVAIGFLGFFFQGDLIDLRYPNAAESSYYTFGYLILSFIPVSVTYVFGTLLTANGSLKQLNYMALFGVILNIVLNFVLINKYKAEGAAMATLITQTVTAFIQVLLVYLIFKFKINFWMYGRIILFALGLVGIIYVMGENPGLRIFSYPMLIYILCSTFLAFALRLIKLSDIKVVFNRSVSQENKAE